jgi:hypothetical protein
MLDGRSAEAKESVPRIVGLTADGPCLFLDHLLPGGIMFVRAATCRKGVAKRPGMSRIDAHDHRSIRIVRCQS